MSEHAHHHATEDLSDRRLVLAIIVNVALTVVQIVGGILSASLSLVADALHNLNDAGSLVIALIARRVGRRPADRIRTFGYRKAETIGALINLTTLILVGLYLVYEAIVRCFTPEPIDGWIVVIIAGVALVIDIITAMLTWAMSRESLNVRAAFIHNLSDAMASVGVIVAGTLILLFEWYLADVIVTLLIAGYVLYQGAVMMRKAIHVLMDSVPAGLSVEEVVAAMETEPGVANVHHIHIWQLGETQRALEAHVAINDGTIDEIERIKRQLKTMLTERFEIRHTSLEMERHDPDGKMNDHDRRVITPH